MLSLALALLLTQSETLPPVVLGVGEQRTVHIPSLQRVAISGGTACDVKTIGNDQLLVIGVAPGREVLLAWTSAGKRVDVPVTVTATPTPPPTRPLRRVDAGPGLEAFELDQELERITGERVVDGGVELLAVTTSGERVVLRVEASSPAGLPTPRPARSAEVSLVVGEAKEVLVPGLSRLVASGGDPFSAQTLGDGRVRLVGARPGRGTLLAWRGDGTSVEIPLRVLPAPKLTSPVEVSLARGEQRVLHVPALQRVAISQTVCDVKTRGNDEVELTGLVPGRSTVLIWDQDGNRIEVRVTVTEDRAPLGPVDARSQLPVRVLPTSKDGGP